MRPRFESLEDRTAPANLAGTLDLTFGNGGIALAASATLGGSFEASAAAPAGNGQTLLAGDAMVQGTRQTVVTRLTAAGQVDTTFGTNGFFVAGLMAGNRATGIQVDASQGGALVVGGEAGNGVNSNREFYVLRLSAGGAPDTNFGTAGFRFLDSAPTDDDQAGPLVIDGAGNYVLTGTVTGTSSRLALARFTAQGPVDTTFGTAGLFTYNIGAAANPAAPSTDNAFGLATQGNAYLLAGATSSGAPAGGSNAVVVKVLPSGQGLDSSFGPQSAGLMALPGFGGTLLGAGSARAVALQGLSHNGGIYVAGGSGTSAFLAHLSAQGILDTSFGSGGTGIVTITSADHNDLATALAVNAADQAVLAGNAAATSGTEKDALLARYNPDGTPDTNFGTSGIALQNLGYPDDNVVALLLPNVATAVVAGTANQSMLAARFLATNETITAPAVTAKVPKNSTAAPIAVLATAQDSAGNALSVTALTSPVHGTATISADGKQVLYTPATSFTGSDTFVATIASSSGLTATARVNVTVVPLPTVTSDRATVKENSSGNVISVLANDADPSGGTLSVQSVTAPGHGSAVVSANGKQVVYTPTPGFFGTDTFTYTALSSNGGSAVAKVTVTVTALAPVANPVSVTVVGNSLQNPINVLASASDPSGGSLRIQSVSKPSHGTAVISANGLQVLYTPSTNFHGVDAFTYTVISTSGATARNTVRVTVSFPVPVASPVQATVAGNSRRNAINVLAGASDPGGFALHLVSVGAPAHGTVTIAGNQVLYTPNRGFHGRDSFTYTVGDGHGNTARNTVSVLVSAAPGAPSVRASALLQAHNGVASFRGHLSLRGSGSASVRVTASHGQLRLSPGSLRVRGNNSGDLRLSGSLATLNRILGTLTLTLGSGHGQAQVRVIATAGRASSQATIAVQF